MTYNELKSLKSETEINKEINKFEYVISSIPIRDGVSEEFKTQQINSAKQIITRLETRRLEIRNGKSLLTYTKDDLENFHGQIVTIKYKNKIGEKITETDYFNLLDVNFFLGECSTASNEGDVINLPEMLHINMITEITLSE